MNNVVREAMLIICLYTEALESEAEEVSSQPQTVMNADSDSDKGESQSSATDVPDSEKSVPQLPVPSQPEPSINRTSMVVKDGVKVGNSGLKHEKKSGSASQLEELDNLTSLSGRRFIFRLIFSTGPC